MTKSEFLRQLSERLQTLSENDRAEALTYWSEMIDDRMEDGLTEEEAVCAVGTPAEAAAQILGVPSMPKQIEPTKTKRERKAWEIVLLILGSPIWLSLLIAVAAVILSLYISVWAVVISLWAAAVSVTVSALPLLAYSIITIGSGTGIALLWLGAALILFGVGLFLLTLSLYLSKLLCRLTAHLFRRKKTHENKEKGL